MSQETTKVTDAIEPATEIPVEEQVSQREGPLPKVFINATNAGKNAYGAAVTRWSELPYERQRIFALVGLSVITSVTVSLLVMIIVRIFTKNRKVAR